MAEPTTASAISAIIIAKAAEKLGSRIGDEIADGIFGKSDDMSDIRNMLKQLNLKVDEILHYSKATYTLVQDLPNVIIGIIEKEKLYHAHNNIESNYETYVRLPQWNNTIGHSTMASLLANWKIVIDTESNLDKLSRLPKYGEFLLLVTNGQFFEVVLNGVDSKIKLLENSMRVEKEDILQPNVNEVERLIKSGYVKSGTLLDAEPWASWVIADKKTRTQKECFDMPCGACNGSITTCYDVQVPDTAWNNQLENVNRQLSNSVNIVSSTIIKIRSIYLVLEILKKYKKSLEDRSSEIKSHSHVKVVESLISFP